MKYRYTPTKQPEAGFTLIELLVVVVLASVLAAIAAPSWLAFANRQRSNSVRSDLVQVLRNAQQDAIQLRQTRTVEIDEVAPSPTVRVNGREQTLGSGGNNSGQVALEAYGFNADDTQNAAINSIAFDYRGLPVGTDTLPFVVAISSGQSTAQQCVMVANLLGAIKLASNADCDNPVVSVN
ncbi:prepilin-type N-terminal cleavage/methylation domain-containing protein [Nodosilinea sp. LEGE 07088]|uniref:pilus assembly FimT family protein n=1 Tax=Nodosilinea sp. LEGE 07088 TaxID=2777968 RepID=UPI00187E6DB9|nr:prepilin-type N-terminal cleavage/methylation domain-containing protein [Nodosilinea sp. LEGE 07088]MBE9135825.1 prepilin-type N-terminal cleavage/methylation domain-containing protein [Nodosilinea sp. LEGE 07088]